MQSHQIRFLLLDSSNVLVGKIEGARYKETVGNFLRVLAKTKLQKLARVNSSEQTHEERVIAIAVPTKTTRRVI